MVEDGLCFRDGKTEQLYRNWLAYKTGFGYLSGNFWLGLEKIHRLTNAIQGAMLRVDYVIEMGKTVMQNIIYFE